jgi:transposase
MVGRGELTDAAWAQLEPLPPANGGRGGQWRDHRTVINGVLWKLRTGAPWRDLPARYGPHQTCADRLYRWRRDGTWERVLARVQTQSDAVGEVDWEVSVDSSVARAHQHAAGARRRPSEADAKRGASTRRTRRWGAAGAASPARSTSVAMGAAGRSPSC